MATSPSKPASLATNRNRMKSSSRSGESVCRLFREPHCTASGAGPPHLGNFCLRRGNSAQPEGTWESGQGAQLGHPCSGCPSTPCTCQVGPHSQVEDQVMVSLLRDAVMEPDCGRGPGSQLTQKHCLPPPPALSLHLPHPHTPPTANIPISQSLSTS